MKNYPMIQILIADCGSSKIDWCLITIAGDVTLRFETPGMNALMTGDDEMRRRMATEVAPLLGSHARQIAQVYFYGAGCISGEVCAKVAAALSAIAPDAIVLVSTDLLAAAHALCGRKPGIACIMGTGSNSCFYDGKDIAKGVSPLGFILGDEGSGAVLGKLLVGNVLKRQLPEHVCRAFHDETGLDLLTIINKVYRQPAANKFLASLSPFIARHISTPEVEEMVVESFCQFFIRNVSAYDDVAKGAPVNFVGSIAYHYRPQLKKAAERCGYVLGTVYKAPMEGLIAYHSHK